MPAQTRASECWNCRPEFSSRQACFGPLYEFSVSLAVDYCLLGCDTYVAEQTNYCLISIGLHVSPLGEDVSAIRFSHQRIP